ncbi:hypothetical protein JMJ77_0005503 [Colletotrichum scovillei]|uniref:Uncharacterized protein n=1 Tax=Colletotrichum scovillei TaxID=1209932 RepID=A0A9P7RJH3_9PEZI|nr:hypothetical protein JMJ77_0005503 [Colletotrichum scovillei]KAG7076726.1 hypothetical protein JMJ76_0013986 [Colletotrichum scovillei]KAG7083922.1 hypothetical protein JMJ78_0009363 [Colletotrichum scovillei]
METPFGLASGHLEDLDLLFYDVPVPVESQRIRSLQCVVGRSVHTQRSKAPGPSSSSRKCLAFCRSNLALEQLLRAKGARSSLASIHGALLLRRQRRCVSDDMSQGGLTTAAVGSSLGQ